MNLTSSMMNNMNSLALRSLTTKTLNSMNGNLNSGLLQPTVKGTNSSTPKSAAAELDDLLN